MHKLISQLSKVLLPYGLTPVQIKRIVRATVCAIIAAIFNLTYPIEKSLGIAPYLMMIMSVTVHPGRRIGKMIESSILTVSGMVIGLGYSCLCLFIFRVIEKRSTEQAGLGFLVVTEVIMLFTHGVIRSISERLFPFAFLLFLVCHFAFVGASITLPLGDIAKGYSVPILTGVAVAIICSLVIFPEFGSTALGSATVSGLNEMHGHLHNVVTFFVQDSSDDLTLTALQKGKQNLASKLAACKATFTETAYEVSYAYMSPMELQPFLKTLYRSAATTNALIGACESEYALLSYTEGSDSSRNNGSSTPESLAHTHPEFGSAIRLNHLNNNLGNNLGNTASSSALYPSRPSKVDLKSIIDFKRPQKEIEHGNRALLLKYLEKVRSPVLNLLETNSEALNKLKMAIGVAYDVPTHHVGIFGSLDRGRFTESSCGTYNVTITAIDEAAADISRHLEQFDMIVPNLLENISSKVRLEHVTDEFLPRDEYFLLTLFLLNFREYSAMMIQMLIHTRALLLTRQKREQKKFGRRFWFSKISSRKDLFKFLSVGKSDVQESDLRSTNSDMSISRTESRRSHKGQYNGLQTEKVKEGSWRSRALAFMKCKAVLAFDFFHLHQEHVKYGVKFTLLLMLVSFPAFSVLMRHWYADIRGTWVGFVATLTLEPSLGGTTRQFIIRTVGVIVGSAWGYASFITGWLDAPGRVVIIVMMAVGYVFGYYYLIVSPYPKAALIGIVSCSVVVQGTVIPTIPGTILQNFAKRCLAMMVGGTAAMLVQVIVFPVKARDELLKQVVKAIRLCEYIDTEVSNIDSDSAKSSEVLDNYLLAEKSCKEVRRALHLAEEFRELTRQEPRLKGSFKYRSMIFREIIFVLDQIVDRFDNVIFLRRQYGSVILDELSTFMHTYRVEFYGCIECTFRSLEQALATKTPLPQYMPSSRIAHVRLVNRVREALLLELHGKSSAFNGSHGGYDLMPQNRTKALETVIHRKYMGWSATSVAFEQVVEFTEELIELVKLLVGEDEFRYGYLSRPLDQDWTLDVLYGNTEEALRMLDQQQRNDEISLPENSASTESDAAIGPRVSKIETFDFSSPEQYFVDDRDELGDIPLTLRKIASKRSRTLSVAEPSHGSVMRRR